MLRPPNGFRCKLCKRALTSKQRSFHSKRCENIFLYQQKKKILTGRDSWGTCQNCGDYVSVLFESRKFCRGCAELIGNPRALARRRELRIALRAVMAKAFSDIEESILGIMLETGVCRDVAECFAEDKEKYAVRFGILSDDLDSSLIGALRKGNFNVLHSGGRRKVTKEFDDRED